MGTYSLNKNRDTATENIFNFIRFNGLAITQIFPAIAHVQLAYYGMNKKRCNTPFGCVHSTNYNGKIVMYK